MAMEIHGIKLVGDIEDLKSKAYSADPSYTEAGHVWFNETDKAFKITTLDENGVVVVKTMATAEEVQAEVSRVEGLITAEKDRAQAAEQALQTQLDNAGTELADEITRVEGLISDEEAARAAADSDLQDAIDVEKGRIDAILDASEADKDSFKEIVDLINSVDTENDEAFAGHVSTYNAKVEEIEGEIDQLQTDLTQEVSDREAAVLAEKTRAEAAESALDARVTTVEGQVNGKIGDLETLTTDAKDSLVAALNEIDANADAAKSAADAEKVRAVAAEDALQTSINSEATTARAAESALSGRLDVIEGEGEGSVAKALVDAKAYTDAEVSGAVSTVKDAVNATKYVETTVAPATAHVIAHNLNTMNVMFTVWVDRGDGVYRNDQVEVKIVDANSIRIGDFGSARNVKVVVESAENI